LANKLAYIFGQSGLQEFEFINGAANLVFGTKLNPKVHTLNRPQKMRPFLVPSIVTV
jgi:hypothetical protein